jgi:hypothetical protein
LKNLSILEISASTPGIIREDVLHLNLLKDPQQCEVTLLGEYKNKNGKRNPKNHITEKNARNLSKKKENLEKL